MAIVFIEKIYIDPDSKVHGANMGPTRVLLVPDGPYIGPMNLAIRGSSYNDADDTQA